MCWSFLLIKLQAWEKETSTQVFSCEICEIFKNLFLKNICERLLLKKVLFVFEQYYSVIMLDFYIFILKAYPTGSDFLKVYLK